MIIREHKLRKCVAFSLDMATLHLGISRIRFAFLLYSHFYRNFAVKSSNRRCFNEQLKYDGYGRKRTESGRYTLGVSIVF